MAGKEYIQMLRMFGFYVEEIDEEKISSYPCDVDVTIFHPAFYAIPRVTQYIKSCNKKIILGAFDVADSSAISRISIQLLNRLFDFVVVPSVFAQSVFYTSGATIPVFVVNHPYREELFNKCEKEIPTGKGLNILFFLLHSGYRKGADILAEALKILSKEGINFTLIIKRLSMLDPFLRLLKQFPHIEIEEFLDVPCLGELYRKVDVLALPSRGGGFERPGLEALAVGTPVVAPAYGSWTEYIPVQLLARVERFEKVFKDNPVHIGLGPRADPADFAEKLIQAPTIDISQHVARIRERFKLENIAKTQMARVANYILGLLAKNKRES